MPFKTPKERGLREIDILTQDLNPRGYWIRTLQAHANAGDINSNGEAGGNQGVAFKWARDQRHVRRNAAYGMALNAIDPKFQDSATGKVGNDYLDDAVNGIKYCFDNMDSDGKWNGSAGISTGDSLGFNEAYWRTLRMLNDVPGYENYTQQVALFQDKAKTAVEWHLDSEDDPTYASEWNSINGVGVGQYNNISSLVLYLLLAGEFLDNNRYRSQVSRWLGNHAGYAQHADGYWLENTGFDSSYQKVNLYRISKLLLYHWTEETRASMQKGLDWWIPYQNADGSLDLTGNTRITTDASVSYAEVIFAQIYMYHVFGYDDGITKAKATFKYWDDTYG